jgi:YbbR domain-containing protein
VNVRRTARRAAGFVTHNWPLKVAAIVLATLLYAGLVATQDSSVYPGPIVVTPVNYPSSETVVTNQLQDVEQVRYIAPADLHRLTAKDFLATVDLAAVKPTGTPVEARVSVVAVDPRVMIVDFQPRTIQVILDESLSISVPVRVEHGPVAAGIDLGETVYTPTEVTVTGPSAAVNRVVAVRVNAALDPGGIDFSRDVEGNAVDASGEVITGVDVEPRTIHVTIPLIKNKQSRTVPVNPILTGSPAPGFRIAAIQTTPLVVSVQGDSEQLTRLLQADTAPVSVFGATRDVSATVTLALPPGVVSLGSSTVIVVVKVEPVTETRTFAAGFRLDGREPALDYTVSEGTVLLTLFGSTADLDRLAAAPLVVGINVAGLAPGAHAVPVVPSLPSGVTVAALEPGIVTVTVAPQPTPPPGGPSSPGPSAAFPSPSAVP